MSLAFSLRVDTRARAVRHRVLATTAALLGIGLSAWLARDAGSPVLIALASGLALLGWLARRRPVAVQGVLSVDDQGRPCWRSDDSAGPSTGAAQPCTVLAWRKSSGSVWIRLSVDSRASVDLFVRQADPQADEHWAALQRWLLWLERGGART